MYVRNLFSRNFATNITRNKLKFLAFIFDIAKIRVKILDQQSPCESMFLRFGVYKSFHDIKYSREIRNLQYGMY